MIELVGYAGGILSSSMLFPQVYKTYKIKKVDDISLCFLYMSIISCILWDSYALIIFDKPLIFSSSVAFISNMMLLYLKWKYKPNLEDLKIKDEIIV